MEPLHLPGVLLLDGHGYASHTAAIDAAAAVLAAAGWSEWDIDDARPDMRPARAWYDDDGQQFVQKHHERARPVTAIHLPGIDPDTGNRLPPSSRRGCTWPSPPGH